MNQVQSDPTQLANCMGSFAKRSAREELRLQSCRITSRAARARRKLVYIGVVCRGQYFWQGWGGLLWSNTKIAYAERSEPFRHLQ